MFNCNKVQQYKQNNKLVLKQNKAQNNESDFKKMKYLRMYLVFEFTMVDEKHKYNI